MNLNGRAVENQPTCIRPVRRLLHGLTMQESVRVLRRAAAYRTALLKAVVVVDGRRMDIDGEKERERESRRWSCEKVNNPHIFSG